MSCRTGKIGYASPQAAAKAAKRIGARRGARSGGSRQLGRMTHYRCQFCAQWHLGHGLRKEAA